MLICINNEPQQKNNKIKTEGSVLEINGIPCSGKISLTLAPGKSVPEYGEMILVKACPRFPEKARNPYDFDYGKSLFYKEIYHTASARTQDWVNLGHFRGNVLVWTSIRARNFLVKTLKDNGLKDDELDIGAALLLGANSDFDPELRQIYGKAGVTHILSVSGLHVGLIFLVFSQILSCIKGNRFNNLLRSFILIVLIWAYAFLTGLSPAVQRSALMLSLVILARDMRRKPHLLNVLSGSAFLILLSDPYLITNLGFQLSYLAVAGIVLLEPLISDLLEFQHPWLEKAWKLCSVSFAAQAATSPLSIFYFHQFPLYFLPANLIIIPLSSFVMYWGLGALSFSWISVLNKPMFYGLNLLVKLMTGFTSIIAGLPFSSSGLLIINTHQSILAYVILISGIAFLSSKRFTMLWICLLSLLSLAFSFSLSKLFLSKKSYLIAYSSPKKSMISIQEGIAMKTLIFHGDTNPGREIGNILINQKIKTHTIQQVGISPKLKNNKQYKEIDVIQFGGKQYLILCDSSQNSSIKNMKNIDGIFVYEPILPNFYPEDLPKGLTFILCGTELSRQNIEKWSSLCNQLHIRLFNLKKRGAFVLSSGKI